MHTAAAVTQGGPTAMNVPTIGGARGIFEIFVPGLFLLLNLVGATYLLPFLDQDTKHFIEVTATNPGLSLMIVVSFGYLLGVLLRLGPTGPPDRLSGFWLGHVGDKSDEVERNALRQTRFPYIGWMCETSGKRVPAEVAAFYRATWGIAGLATSKTFFNFMKVMLSDESAKGEIYAAEALTRYISGMFYALLVSFGALGGALICLIHSGKGMWGIVVILAAYLFAGLVILRRFRTIRVKEVEAVFAASYRNRRRFRKMAEEADAPG
jgi:hypothetical protein